MEECIFCAITKRQKPAEVVYENDDIVAFTDINPKAPIHILLVPRRHIESINHLSSEDASIVGSLVLSARYIAEQRGFSEKGYRLSFNVGRGGGQLVDHIHLHLMGGWQ